MNLKSIYEKFVQEGVLDSGEFLFEENAELYSFHRFPIELQAASESKDLEFCCLGIEFDRPIREAHEILAVCDGEKLTLHSDVIEFLQNYQSAKPLKLSLEDLKHSQVLKSGLDQWVKDLFSKKQAETFKQFTEDADRLSEYYHLSCSELSHRKKSVFFHNYYFEKEARIREEIEQLRDEMIEQQELLKLRYQPRFEMRVLFFGRVSRQ